MRFTDSRGRKVLDTSTAVTLGKVDGFVVDPTTRRVVAVEVKVKGDADVLPWESLTGFGPDAVTVPDDSALVAAEGRVAELRGKPHALLKKRVLTEDGDELGKVSDVEFDPASGEVTGLLVTADRTESTVDGARLLGAGSYAVVVRRET